MTFSPGMLTELISPRSGLEEAEDPGLAVPVDVPARMMDSERVTSFTYPGGIVAVHARSRSREHIWEAPPPPHTYRGSTDHKSPFG